MLEWKYCKMGVLHVDCLCDRGRGSGAHPKHLLTLEQVVNLFTSSHPPHDSEMIH